MARESDRKLSPEDRKAKRRGRRPTAETVLLLPVQISNGQQAIWSLVIAAAALVCYWNTKECGFVRWDDTKYVIDNPLVTGDGGLKAIWTDVFADKPVRIYYPLTWTSYWIEHKFFKRDAAGYHVVQMILHALASVAVFLAVAGLGAPLLAAAATGLLFAVHPINVASVAWLAERKNTLSAIFFWLALLDYVRYRRRGGVWRYVAAVTAFQLSLFAKTACVVLAPILLVTDRVLDGRWTLRAFVRTAPFFVLALTMGLVTAGAEAENRKSGEPLEWALRPLVAAASVAHYVVKTVVPVDLVPVYARWAESFAVPRYWISLAATLVCAALLWTFWRRIPALAWWGLAAFILALGPVLGFVQFNFLQFAFVSDHFVYLAVPGLLLVVGMAMERIAGGAKSDFAGSEATSSGARRRAVWAVLFAIVAVFGWLTIRQNRVWMSPVSFWTFTLEHNPGCSAGTFNLGNYYYERQDYDSALKNYRRTAELEPDYIIYQRACARACAQLGRQEEAIAYYLRAIENHTRKKSRGIKDRMEFAGYLLSVGKADQALREYEEVLVRQPNYDAAQRGAERARARLN